MISKIYTAIETKIPGPLDQALADVLDRGTDAPVKVFFRADDIGVSSRNFTRMMDLFLKYRMPLCLAVVPSWLTRQRWEVLESYVEQKNLFCWHMHGYAHKNHETQGKKQEFGPARSSENLFRDLSRGQARLESIMGDHLAPFFTPPWNRCCLEAMNHLKTLKFKAVSRSMGNLPPAPEGLGEISVHVDLHTRKDKDALSGWTALLKEMETGLATGCCGIMIHHMRMNDPAFLFLEHLLNLISRHRKIQAVTFQNLF
ncbi:polysaccharide deacetylase family protein [Desulfospira joergensenii]|uniref:polysaccharide deacetylase family protein n=1 Tax=Desulfospira joergensenii TaxID=53329 RepID=UPI0003B75C7B|nr:polysaccharide deacetylase family protein [Desulfospira joergensenii]